MKITGIECFVLLVSNYDRGACSSAQDDLVVKISTDAGITGVGEVDTNPWVAKAAIEAPGTHIMGLGLKEMLLGADPLEPEVLWERMYVGSAMTGRRGAGICAIGALDMALWDIRGKALGQPVWKLLGGARRRDAVPYASLLPTGRTLDEYRESLVAKAQEARKLGFKAVKLEVCIKGPYSHNSLQEDNAAIVEVVAVCREAIGPATKMMVDVAYCWQDAKEALAVIEKLEPYDIFFVETPLPSDDLAGYAFLADHSPVRIAAGEWLSTRFEFLDLMDRGHVDVIQPDVGRVGGVTEARRVVHMAHDRGKLVVPHCWKTGIGIAASVHLSISVPNCPFIEFLPAPLAESPLRKELLADELPVVDGIIPLPTKPGLGIELDEKALRRYRVA